MSKPIVWSRRSLNDLRKIYDFHVASSGLKFADKIVANILDKADLLESNKFDYSHIGSVDESFSHLKYSYRKLIEGHYKITYRIGRGKIYIVRIFDTRQNPNKNK